YKNYYIPMCRPTKTTINQIPNFAHIGFRDVIVLEEEELIQVAKDGKMMNKNIQIHASEDYNLREKWINEYSESDIIWSIKNLNVDSIVHLTHADENDIMVMKKNKISAILCISSNIFTKVGIPPLKLIMDEGINIAIGTDNAMINELNLIQEMRLINRQINLPLKVLKMATINGAKVGKVNWGIKIGCSNFIKINFQNYNNKDIIYDYIINSEWYRRKNSIWQPRDYGMEI
ncbi:MAG: amidohydrolase family protein, partial [Candidatus Heimdallarchaeota archaeon]|nr:amidohydrolase family protein [Candidatus Heimdallarchaeota archaeon]